MGKFLDADSVHQGIFTPEEIDVLNFATKTVTVRLQLTTQDEVENVATSAISLYSSGITDPDLLLQEILSRFGEPTEPFAAVHLDDQEKTTARTLRNSAVPICGWTAKRKPPVRSFLAAEARSRPRHTAAGLLLSVLEQIACARVTARIGLVSMAEVSHVLQHTRDTLHELRRYLAQAGYREILSDIETLVASAEEEARRELGRLASRQGLPNSI